MLTHFLARMHRGTRVHLMHEPELQSAMIVELIHEEARASHLWRQRPCCDPLLALFLSAFVFELQHTSFNQHILLPVVSSSHFAA